MKSSDNAPLLSILLPTLNARRFLEERINSILNQTFQDWELIIIDSHSTDGTWEFLNRISSSRPIFRYQIPKGLYQAWNFGISKARGTYVYIATADDTMKPDCLEKMTAALEAHPECGICDTMLQLLDADGKEIDESSDQFVAHYWHFDFPRNSVHIRKKPHDFFLHLGGKTVYTSITQILIRKSLFEKTGPFPVNFGRSADFQWGMRAALNTDVIYLPQQLASWRIHSEQTTASRNPQEINSNFALMLKMAEQCIEEWNDPKQQKRSRWLVRLMYFKAKLLPAKQNSNRWFLLLRCVLQTILSNPLMLAEFTLRSLRFYGKGKRKLWLIRTYDSMILARVHRLKLSHLIVPVEADTLRRGGGKP